MQNKEHSSKYPLWIRILSLALAGLTASGVLVYIITFIINLFH